MDPLNSRKLKDSFGGVISCHHSRKEERKDRPTKRQREEFTIGNVYPNFVSGLPGCCDDRIHSSSHAFITTVYLYLLSDLFVILENSTVLNLSSSSILCSNYFHRSVTQQCGKSVSQRRANVKLLQCRAPQSQLAWEEQWDFDEIPQRPQPIWPTATPRMLHQIASLNKKPAKHNPFLLVSNHQSLHLIENFKNILPWDILCWQSFHRSQPTAGYR